MSHVVNVLSMWSRCYRRNEDGLSFVDDVFIGLCMLLVLAVVLLPCCCCVAAVLLLYGVWISKRYLGDVLVGLRNCCCATLPTAER